MLHSCACAIQELGSTTLGVLASGGMVADRAHEYGVPVRSLGAVLALPRVGHHVREAVLIELLARAGRDVRAAQPLGCSLAVCTVCRLAGMHCVSSCWVCFSASV